MGDEASQTAFREVLERWRKRARRDGDDPLGKVSNAELTKKELDRAVCKEPDVAALVNGAADEFSGQLADVIEHFMRHLSWHAIERIIVGGGFQQSLAGERAIARASLVLRSRGIMVELRTLRRHADDGGLIGWVHLAPRRMLVNGYNAILAVDIGSTNARFGIVRTNMAGADDLSEAVVGRRAKWRHADDDPNRKGLADMLVETIQYAERKCIVLAPLSASRAPAGLSRG